MTGPTRFQRRSGALGGVATQGFWVPGAPENTPDPSIPYLPLEGAGAGPSPTAPTITAHPANATSLLDATGQTFSVSVSGFPTPTLQWEQNTGSGWSNVTGGSGATTLTYTAPTATASLNGIQYRCVATNTEGSATSNAATWTIIPARALTSGGSITDGTTFNGASITVGQNRLGIVNLVQVGVATDDRVAPISVRIGSHELTQIGTPIAIDAFTFKTAWRCLSTSAAITGTLTMEWAASDVQDSVAWGAIEWENRDTSGTNGSGAVHTPATNTGTGTAMTVGSIADPGSSGDFVCATWAWEDANAADGQTHSPGAGLFELSESNALDTTWYGAQAISVGVKASSVAGTLTGSETWVAHAFVVKTTAGGGSFNDSAADAVTAGDSASSQGTHGVAATDAATPGDSATSQATAARDATDAVTPGDSATSAAVFAAAATDAATPGDSANATRTQAASATDAATPGDSATTQATMGATATDAAAPGDSASSQATAAVSATDAVTPADAASSAAASASAATDAVTPTDAAQAQSTLATSATDAVTPTDAASSQSTAAASATDALALTDSASLDAAGGVVATDPVTPGDSATSQSTGAAQASDAVTVGDAAASQAIAAASAVDAIAPGDAADAARVASASATDAIALADSASITGNVYDVGAVDGLDLGDEADTVLSANADAIDGVLLGDAAAVEVTLEELLARIAALEAENALLRAQAGGGGGGDAYEMVFRRHHALEARDRRRAHIARRNEQVMALIRGFLAAQGDGGSTTT